MVDNYHEILWNLEFKLENGDITLNQFDSKLYRLFDNVSESNLREAFNNSLYDSIDNRYIEDIQLKHFRENYMNMSKDSIINTLIYYIIHPSFNYDIADDYYSEASTDEEINRLEEEYE